MDTLKMILEKQCENINFWHKNCQIYACFHNIDFSMSFSKILKIYDFNIFLHQNRLVFLFHS